ncbi:MAG: manganese efflux pump MntP family protein [Defluviitaleaceae bacterium]|nr:manganese efflux pump MntP family protein [Defluviitaleaceae bacterium]
MNFFELVILSAGLAMDAMAVAVCVGMAVSGFQIKTALRVGLWFGVFQAGMPVLGYFVGGLFSDFVSDYAGYVAFGLLAFLGIKMLWDGVKSDSCPMDADVSAAKLFPLAVATSVDALAVGVSFAVLSVSPYIAALLIGLVTVALSAAGVFIGGLAGRKFDRWARIFGGVVLIALGFRILFT